MRQTYVRNKEHIFSLHQGNTYHISQLTMDIDTGDIYSIAQDHIFYHLIIMNGLVMKRKCWKKLELFNKVFLLGLVSNVIVPKKAQPREALKKVCIDYHTLNSLLTPIVRPILRCKVIILG